MNGAIDVYVEYTGTLAQAILKLEGPAPDPGQLDAEVSDLACRYSRRSASTTPMPW